MFESASTITCPRVDAREPGPVRLCVFFAGQAARCRSDSVTVHVAPPLVLAVAPPRAFLGDAAPVNVTVQHFRPAPGVRCGFFRNRSADTDTAEPVTVRPLQAARGFLLCPVPQEHGPVTWHVRVVFAGGAVTETYRTLELRPPEVVAMAPGAVSAAAARPVRLVVRGLRAPPNRTVLCQFRTSGGATVYSDGDVSVDAHATLAAVTCASPTQPGNYTIRLLFGTTLIPLPSADPHQQLAVCSPDAIPVADGSCRRCPHGVGLQPDLHCRPSVLLVWLVPLASVVGCGAALGAGVLLHRRTRRRRVLRSVPGGSAPGADVVLVFTDIQDSTTLWDTHPAAMQQVLERHNRHIRALIDDCGGYEVKIMGDAFMVCFPDVDRSLAFMARVQAEFLDLDWPEEILEAQR